MSDVLIIGGGIIGLITARELSMAGASVTLIERGKTGQESSWAGGGILSPLYPWRYGEAVTALASWSQDRYPQLAQELEESTGLSPELTRNGLLILDTEEQNQACAWARRHSISLERIDSARIKELEPELAVSSHEALWMPGIAQVRNPRLTQALRMDIKRRGVTVRSATPVVSLSCNSGRIQGVVTTTGSVDAEKVILCAGAWSGDLLSACPRATEIRPVKGQMILFQAPPGLLKRITLFRDRYTIPRREGRILMGSTLEETGFDKGTTAEVQQELRSIAIERFPSLATCPIEHHWAGLRPFSPSGIPYIGPHPEIEGLFINSGHFRNGVVLAPASCRLMADMLLDRPCILDPAPYALGVARP